MISIEHHGNGYRVRITTPGMGFHSLHVQARDLKEVHRCVEHYFVEKPHMRRLRTGCPLCASVKERTKP